MQLGIGTKLTYRGREYVVRPAAQWQSCAGCAFSTCGHPTTGICYGKVQDFTETFGECSAMSRTDKRYVIFEEVR